MLAIWMILRVISRNDVPLKYWDTLGIQVDI